MGKINFSDNLFIGTQELKTFQENILQYKTILGYLTNHYGFVDLRDSISYEKGENNCWKVIPGTGATLMISTPSFAFAYPNNLIAWTDSSRVINVPISLLGKNFWVKISYKEDSFEKGTLSINSSGVVTGTNTEFLSKLRGEPNFASVIELFSYNSVTNLWVSQGQYIVDSVNTDTNCVLNILNGRPDTTISYIYKVVGTFPMNTVLTMDMKYPFIYDSCNVELVEEVIENKAPEEISMMVSNTSFYIARVEYNNQGVLTILEDTKYYFEDSTLFDPKYSKWWTLK